MEFLLAIIGFFSLCYWCGKIFSTMLHSLKNNNTEHEKIVSEFRENLDSIIDKILGRKD